MWTAKLSRFSNVLGFSEDNELVFILNDKQNNFEMPENAYLSRYGTATGKLVNETPTAFPTILDVVATS